MESTVDIYEHYKQDSMSIKKVYTKKREQWNDCEI